MISSDKLQWGRDLSGTETTHTSVACALVASFNGAVTCRARKLGLEDPSEVSEIALQWGRDLSGTETHDEFVRREVDLASSMGPRPFGRGNSASSRPSITRRHRFNGAATFRSRKLVALVYCIGRPTKLQWGRDLLVTETRSRNAVAESTP